MEKRLGIFGGAFDPVHTAHLRIALETSEKFNLDKIFFIPYAKSPHLKNTVASIEKRLYMLKLATQNNTKFLVSRIEASIKKASYTIQTLKKIKYLNPNSKIFFLIGIDAFIYLHTWHKAKHLFNYADFIIMNRPQYSIDLLKYAKKKLNSSFVPTYNGWFRCDNNHGFKKISNTIFSISSSNIRLRLSKKLSITYLVQPSVEQYIKQSKLYKKIRH